MAKNCLECGNITKFLLDDPRTPPLETKPCICQGCMIGILEEQIDELLNQLNETRGLKRKLERR